MKHLAKLFLYGVLACGATLVTGQAHAALLSNVDTAGCDANVAINNAIGQSFRVNEATSLEKIDIWIKPELYYTTSYTLELYDGEGTSGTRLGTSATTVTLGSQSGGTPSGFQAFSFTNLGLVLQASHADTFRLYGTQASAPGAQALQLSSSTGSYVDVGSLSIPENSTIQAVQFLTTTISVGQEAQLPYSTGYTYEIDYGQTYGTWSVGSTGRVRNGSVGQLVVIVFDSSHTAQYIVTIIAQ